MTFFLLGKQPGLSIAELSAATQMDFSEATLSNHILLTPDHRDDLSHLQERLAGIVKSGWIMGEVPEWDKETIADLVVAYASEAAGKEKISFGVSLYDLSGKGISKDQKKELERLGLTIKKQLRETGRPVRYVSSKEPDLSSVIVQTNHLLESGGEFVLLLMADKILIGQTQTVQDFQAWSDRDFGRPARDAKSGMLPPKLARTLINLSGINPEEKVVLDPFCGSGTVLMEAALMGAKKIIASDISDKAVQDTAKNITWLLGKHVEELPEFALFQSPAENLTEQLEEQADIIATELYLGPPRKGKESIQALKHKMQDIEKLVSEAFAELRSLIADDGVIVAAFPSYLTNSTPVSLPLKKLLPSLGYEILDPIPESAKHLNLPLSLSGGILYQRKGQLVAREILVFRKK